MSIVWWSADAGPCGDGPSPGASGASGAGAGRAALTTVSGPSGTAAPRALSLWSRDAFGRAPEMEAVKDAAGGRPPQLISESQEDHKQPKSSIGTRPGPHMG